MDGLLRQGTDEGRDVRAKHDEIFAQGSRGVNSQVLGLHCGDVAASLADLNAPALRVRVQGCSDESWGKRMRAERAWRSNGCRANLWIRSDLQA